MKVTGAGVAAAGIGSGAAGSASAQSGAMVVDNFDGDPGWSSNRNDLGKWTGAGGYSTSITDGALRLEFEAQDTGWYKTKVGQDVSSYSQLEMDLRADSSGDAGKVNLKVGSTSLGSLADATEGSVGTSFSTVSVSLDSLSVDTSSFPTITIKKPWGNEGGAIEIEEIRFASGSTGGGTPTDDTQAPSTPTGVTVSGRTTSSVTVSWGASSDEGGSGLDHYRVTAGGNETTVPAGTTSATIDGLSADSSYTVSVMAVDGAGNTSDAGTVEAMTMPDDDGSVDGMFSLQMNGSLAAGNSAWVSVMLEDLSANYSGSTLEVSISDTSKATISEAEVNSDYLTSLPDTGVSSDGSSATLVALDGADNVNSGMSSVEIGRVKVMGESEGETMVNVDVVEASTMGSTTANFSTENMSMQVQPGGSPPPDESPLMVEFSPSNPATDASTTAMIKLTGAASEYGFGGATVSVSVGNTDVASITGASAGQGLTNMNPGSGSADSVTIAPTDVTEAIQPGSDLAGTVVGTVSMDTGSSAGSTEVTVEFEGYTADDGDAPSSGSMTKTLQVGDTGGPTPPTGSPLMVEFSPSNPETDASTTAMIKLTEEAAEYGFGGTTVSVSVGNTGVASITGASAGDGLTNMSPGGVSSSSVTMAPTDVTEAIEPGGDVAGTVIGTVSMDTGSSAGSTEVTVEFEGYTADDGEAPSSGSMTETLQVGDGGGPTPPTGSPLMVEFSPSNPETDASTTAMIKLTEEAAEYGFGGTTVSVSVGDTSVASITGASAGDGLTNMSPGGVSGSSVTMAPTDVTEAIEPGGDVAGTVIGTVSMDTGSSAGSTDVTVEFDGYTADDGEAPSSGSMTETLQVGDTGGPTPPDESPLMVEFSPSNPETDASTTAMVKLTEAAAEYGFGGTTVSVSVGDTSVATIKNAMVGDGLTNMSPGSGTSDSVTMAPTDVTEAIEPGGDVAGTVIGTVSMDTGSSAGSTEVTVEFEGYTADDGEAPSSGSMTETLQVGDTGGPTPPDESPLMVEFSPSNPETDASTTAMVKLTEAAAEYGFGGTTVSVSVSDTSVASITGASTGDGLTNMSPGGVSESSATMAPTDVTEAIEPGGDVAGTVVGTVSMDTGSSAGSTDVTVEFDGFTADEGDAPSSGSMTETLQVGEDEQSEQTVSVDLAMQEINADGSAWASVMLSEAPNGLSGATVKLSVEDTSIATVSEAQGGTQLETVSTSISSDSSTATVAVMDNNEMYQPDDGSSDIELARVKVMGQSEGDTNVAVAVDMIDNDNSESIPVQTAGTMLSVAGTPTPTESPLMVEFSPSNPDPGASTTAMIKLTEMAAEYGFGGATVSVSVSDTSVASITGASTGDGLTNMSPGGVSESSATMAPTDVTEAIEPGGDVAGTVVGTVSMDTGSSAGSTDVSLEFDGFTADEGDAPSTGSMTKTLQVGDTGGPTPPELDPVVGGSSPTDPDEDGLFEDVNGNGVLEFTDVLAFYHNRNSAAIQNHPDAYDFNGNEEIDIDDTVSLFEEMGT